MQFMRLFKWKEYKQPAEDKLCCVNTARTSPSVDIVNEHDTTTSFHLSASGCCRSVLGGGMVGRPLPGESTD